jgi:hypothetical protein
LLAGTRPATRRVVTEISNQLGYTLADDIESILAGRNEALRESRGNSRRGRRGRRDSGRREVLEQIEETWPELADRREWVESPLLDDGDQDQLLAELQALPSYEEYVRRRDERSESTAARQQAELRDVKYQRLIRTLESIVLAKNLPLVAPPEVYDRYAQMVSLEESSLDGR